MKKDVMVSVIIPVYNREKLISRAIESVVRQTYHNWELIIINDGSTDKTVDIIKNYSDFDTRVICIDNKRLKGVSGARNTGIKYAKGKYIAFLDSDDEWIEIHLEECLHALKITQYKLCSTLWIEEKFGVMYYIDQERWFKDMLNDVQQMFDIDKNDQMWKFDKRLLEYIINTDFYCFHINTIVVDRQLLNDVGGFDEKLHRSEDLDLVYRLLIYTKLVTINNYHFIYHFGEDNLYAFINHYSLDIVKTINDKNLVIKLSYNLRYKIMFLKKLKKMIKASKDILDKRSSLKKINYYLYNREMSYAYINKETRKVKSIYSIIRAVKYMPCCIDKEESLLNLLSDYRKMHLFID